MVVIKSELVDVSLSFSRDFNETRRVHKRRLDRNFNILIMKSTKSSSEKSTAIDDTSSTTSSTRRLSENAHKVQIMLRRRREMMAAQQGKLRIEENSNEKKPNKSDGINNQKSEPTSEVYDDDEELPELTLTENSESYDSNDSLNNVVAATKDLMDKG